MGVPPEGGIDPQIAKLIRFKVGRMFGNAHGYTREDREDLEQDAWVHVVVGMRRYDAKRARPRTFAARIVNSKLKTAIKHRHAEKRDRRRVSPRNPEELDLPDARHDRELLDDQIDVREALDRLPPELRAIATLFETLTEAEVTRRTGMSRQTVRGMRQRIARHLGALKKDRSLRPSNQSARASGM
jgi:RNA polymerase sigma-70 factor (ECF subfamily)